MRITRAALDAIRAHGAEGYPDEICGIMIGPRGEGMVTRVERARNLIGQPHSRWDFGADRTRDRYEMDPRDQMRIQREADREGLDVVGYYHSHPDHPARASRFDAEQAWAGYVYLIVAIQNGQPADAATFVAERDHGPLNAVDMEIV